MRIVARAHAEREASVARPVPHVVVGVRLLRHERVRVAWGRGRCVNVLTRGFIDIDLIWRRNRLEELRANAAFERDTCTCNLSPNL